MAVCDHRRNDAAIPFTAGESPLIGRFPAESGGRLLLCVMDVLKIESSQQICEITHCIEQSLMRVRFHRDGRAQEGYLEFFEVPRSVFAEFQRIEDDARRAGKHFGKAKKPQNVGLYYSGTLRALFSGVRVLANGGRMPLD